MKTTSSVTKKTVASKKASLPAARSAKEAAAGASSRGIDPTPAVDPATGRVVLTDEKVGGEPNPTRGARKAATEQARTARRNRRVAKTLTRVQRSLMRLDKLKVDTAALVAALANVKKVEGVSAI